MANKNQKERFHFLDGLRGIAASLIVIHHSFMSNVAKFFDAHHLPFIGQALKGFTQSGVQLFFVLSGVVLLRPYLRGQRQFKTLDYFYRRAKRIYPPFWGALVFGSLVIFINNRFPTWYSVILVQFSWQGFLNHIPILNINPPVYNAAWWSLQIEMLFYLFVPIFVYIFKKIGVISTNKLYVYLFGMVVSVLAIQLLCTQYFPGFYSIYSQSLNIKIIINYLVCFFMGIYLASNDPEVKAGYNLMIAGALLLVVSYFYRPMVESAYGLIYGGFLVLSFNMHSIKRVLGNPYMIWLGERSYSLFLIHFSVFYITDFFISHFLSGRGFGYAFFSRAIGIPMAMFAAMLLFHFVERYQARGLVTADAFWPWQAKKAVEAQGLLDE